MPWLRKNTKRPFVNVEKRERFGVHGGQLLIEALCRQFRVWDEFPEAQLPKPTRGVLSQAIVAQLLFSFTMGVPILQSGDRFRRDPVLQELLGLEFAADEAILRAWLEGQDWQSVRVLRAMNSNLVRQVMSEWGAATKPESPKAFRLVESQLLSPEGLKARLEKRKKAKEGSETGDNAVPSRGNRRSKRIGRFALRREGAERSQLGA